MTAEGSTGAVPASVTYGCTVHPDARWDTQLRQIEEALVSAKLKNMWPGRVVNIRIEWTHGDVASYVTGYGAVVDRRKSDRRGQR